MTGPAPGRVFEVSDVLVAVALYVGAGLAAAGLGGLVVSWGAGGLSVPFFLAPLLAPYPFVLGLARRRRPDLPAEVLKARAVRLCCAVAVTELVIAGGSVVVLFAIALASWGNSK